MTTRDDTGGIGDTDLFCDVCTEERGIDLQTLEQTIRLAVEIAREGREGRKIGTMFVVSDAEETLQQSTCLILDPLLGHPDEQKQIDDPDMRETVKELAQLDGAFLISDDGIVLSATRYINASSEGIELPLGLGSRHMAAASITRHTNAIAVVVSESSVVRIVDDGEIVSEIIPELWLLRRHGLHLRGPYSTRANGEMTIASKKGTVEESQ
jgi:DNA integrity scanning protein DisA with diadenylate cyclase activity